VLHHDAVQVVADELLFESYDIWTVFAPGLEVDFALDLVFMSLVHLAECDDFHSEYFIG